MRVTPMTPQHLRAGPLTLFAPTHATLTRMATAPLDPRRLSYDQRDRARSAAADRNLEHLDPPLPSPWIGLTVDLAGASPDSVAETLRRFVTKHESLRSGITLTPAGDEERRTIAGHAYDVIASPLGLGTTEENFTRLQHVFAATTSATQWPAHGFATISDPTRPDLPTRLVIAVDHSTYDGLSAYLNLAELPTIHDAVLKCEAPDQPAISFVDFAEQERSLGDFMSPEEPRLQPWRRLVGHGRELPGLPPSMGVARGEPHPHAMVSLTVATPEESDTYAQVAHREGQTAPMAFTGLLAAGLAAQGDRVIRCLFSTHGRPCRESMASVGWYAAVAPMVIDLNNAHRLDEIMTITANSWQEAQPGSVIPLGLAADLLGHPVTPALVISYIHGERIAGHERWRSTSAQIVVGDVPPSDQVHVWINRMPEGTTFDIRLPDTDRCHEWAHRVAAASRGALLKALTAHRSELVTGAVGPSRRTPCR